MFSKLKLPQKKNYLSIFGTLFILLAIPITVFLTLNSRSNAPKAASVLRGTSGDLWADTILGKRDFTEISPGLIVPNKVDKPAGVVVDRNNNRAYIFDALNSRILGINLTNCYASTTTCSAASNAGGIVIGQSSATDQGACNLDGSFQSFPNRVPASATTVCGLNEGTRSIAEILPFVQMAVDGSGRLIFPDFENHRILIYDNPYNNNTVANQVIGQSSFAGNLCNQGNVSAPSSSSLCLLDLGGHTAYSGAGVTIEPATGDLWVADNGNNRVLRFRKEPSSPGHYQNTADLVLGQNDFTHGTYGWGSGPNQFSSPNSLIFGPSGELYVADAGNARVQVFNTPFSSSMNATRTFGSLVGSIGAVDPGGGGFWENNYTQNKLTLWSWSGTLLRTLGGSENYGGGIGIDSQENVLVAGYSGANNVALYKTATSNKSNSDRWLFLSPIQGHENSRMQDGAGVAVAGNQLFVSDQLRVLFWNNPTSVTNGQAAEGCLIQISCNAWDGNLSGFVGQIKTDSSNRVWVRSSRDVKVFQAPVTSGAAPIATISYPLNVLGGGQITALTDKDGTGLLPSADGKFLWLTEGLRNRILRIRDPLTNPMVDLVLGQTDLTSTLCNRGLIGEEGLTGTGYPNTLCVPGDISIDRKGNLYVSDQSLESSGNRRLLMFKASIFPTTNTSVVFAPSDPKYNAAKIFPTNSIPGIDFFAPWEPAFDSTNRMVLGLNTYWAQPSVAYYNDPTDPTKTSPDGFIKDYNAEGLGATFDQNDNLYLASHTRGRLLIYKQPFVEPVGNVAPTVQITSHQNNGWYSGRQIFKANITDDYKSYSRVEFFLDNNLISTSFLDPYQVAWDPTSDGPHTLTVKAYDNFEKIGQSSVIFNMDSQGPGKDVLWNSPTNGATVSGRIPISVNADDIVSGTKRVDFYVDGSKVASDDTADSYGFWWNTSSVANGTYLLEAKAYDQPNNLTTLSITVNVNNPTVVPDPIGQVYLNSVAVGTYAEYSEQRLYPLNATTQVEAIDEEVPDDLWSFVFTNGNNARYRTSGKIDSTKIPLGAKISSIDVFARAQNVTGSPNMKILLRAGGVDNYSAPIAITSTNFTDYKNTWITNPATGIPWTIADLVNAEVGVQAWHALANAHRVTAVWAIVNYSSVSPKTGDVTGDGRVNILDISSIINNWDATSKPVQDINQDGRVNILDISLVIANWF